MAIQPLFSKSYAAWVVLGVLLAACEKAAPPAPPLAVEVMTIAAQEVPITREWVGVLDGDVNATIRPQVTGYLLTQNYKEGQLVKKGAVLFEIDARTFKTSTAQAQAVLAQQQAVHTNAQQALERVRPLVEQNALSKKELDDALSREASARGALDQARAALEAARLNLGFTQITSPIDGIVGIAKAQIGDLLTPSSEQELTTVSTVDPIKVNISLSEREYLEFHEKAALDKPRDIPLEMVLVDGSIFPEKGRFSVMDRQVDANTGTFRVTTLFPNPDAVLRPGQFARLKATIAVKKDAILVPQRAITEVQGRYLIAVVGEGNKIAVRPVKATERIGSDWLIEEGLTVGETIVVEGTQKARPGTVVSPKPFVAKASDKEGAAEEKPLLPKPSEEKLKGK